MVWGAYDGVLDCIVVSVNSVVNCDSCMHIYPFWLMVGLIAWFSVVTLFCCFGGSFNLWFGFVLWGAGWGLECLCLVVAIGLLVVWVVFIVLIYCCVVCELDVWLGGWVTWVCVFGGFGGFVGFMVSCLVIVGV